MRCSVFREGGLLLSGCGRKMHQLGGHIVCRDDRVDLRLANDGLVIRNENVRMLGKDLHHSRHLRVLPRSFQVAIPITDPMLFDFERRIREVELERPARCHDEVVRVRVGFEVVDDDGAQRALFSSSVKELSSINI